MPIQIIYRLLRKSVWKRITRRKAFYVVLFFVSMWIINALLFYYSEHIVAGREDVDIYTALYWSIITMATIGYGDVTPARGLGWVVAGFAAIMGIIAYTLTISVIADWFLSISIRRSLGMAPLKNKEILVIGDTDTCYELLDELRINNYLENTGLVTPQQPREALDIDYVVGDPASEETLRKAGIEKAKHIFLCLSDDSKALYLTLLIRSINKDAEIHAVVRHAKTERLLKQAGAKYVVSSRILGRTIASALFEPQVLTILTDIVSARGKGDLIQEKITKKHAGKTIKQYIEEKNKKDPKHRYTAIALIRNQDYQIAPEPNTILQENDVLVIVKGRKI